MTTNDGGPAFPRRALLVENQHMWDECDLRAQSGMSLRDWFAGHQSLSDLDSPDVCLPEDVAESLAEYAMPTADEQKRYPLAFARWEASWRAALRYIRADAMLAERAKGSAEPSR